MKRLVLIDGNAIIHRAFHGLPPLTSKNGELVNAVYGFFSMFLKILGEVEPQYTAVCFDRPKPTFRKALFAGYQSKRPQMADGLSPQFGMVRIALERAKIAIFEVDGYEADDLIGTLAVQSVEEKDIEVIILTGDRDLLQLVNPRVKIYAPVVGISQIVMFDEHKVLEKYGIKPSQFIDYKALIGDNSDNYPGVAGIGPKTAANLLQEFGTFENLYNHLGDVAPKIAEKLATDAEQAALAKKLATIVTDAPIHFEKVLCDMKEFDKKGLKDAFLEFGFESLVKRLTNGTQETPLRQGFAGQAKKEKPRDEQLGLLE